MNMTFIATPVPPSTPASLHLELRSARRTGQRAGTHLGWSGEKVASLSSMESGMRAGRRVWVLSMIHVLHGGQE